MSPRQVIKPRGIGDGWLALAIALATFAAYAPALSAGFIWDDDDYLTANPNLHDAAGLARLWIPGTTKQYYPVVFTTFWVERQLWGLDPAGYHAVNVLLHAANALLVWRLCKRLGVPGAWFVGAVFSLHPVHVESVAWITERKNVLSGFFYLLAAISYLRFDDARCVIQKGPRPDAGADQIGVWSWYGVSLTLFVCALLSKSVTCSLPAALILMLLWLGRPVSGRTIAALLPMFALGLIAALHTAHLERTIVGAVGPEFDFTLPQRLLIAANALLFYPMKLLAPWPLIFIYPRWALDSSRFLSYWPAVLHAVIAITSVAAYRRGWRGPALGLAFYAGTIFPALGFFNVYPMLYSFVADHFQYLASLGVLTLVISAAATWLANSRLRLVLGASVLIGLACLTWQRCWAYQSEETLWRITIHQNPGAWMARNNLGKLLAERGELDEALHQLQAAHDIVPKDIQIMRNLASVLRMAGRAEEALIIYQSLSTTGSERDMAFAMMKAAQTLDDLERVDEAEDMFQKAIASTALDPESLMLYGAHLTGRGRSAEALEHFKRFVQLRPDDANAQLILAEALANLERFEDAIRFSHMALETARRMQQPELAQQAQQMIQEYSRKTNLPN